MTTDRPQVLISHVAEEKPLAQAWKKLIETLYADHVSVRFSSDERTFGGINTSRSHLADLYQYIMESQIMLALQTPSSAGNSWIMWETGAFGLAKVGAVIPIVYIMKPGELNNPLNYYTSYWGDDADSIQHLCISLTKQFELNVSDFIYEKAIKTYLNTIYLHLVSEEERVQQRKQRGISALQIAMWRNRIEMYVQAGRSSELNVLRQLMYASLGKPPVDLALHETLGKLLIQLTEFEKGLEEINYALFFAPGDISLLYDKALALVELRQLSSAEHLIEHIIGLDANLEKNAEIATLRGRIYREQWRESGAIADLDAAIQTYYKIYQADPFSYYAGINAASLAFIKGDETFGRKIAQEVLELCLQLQSQQNVSYWVDFTAGEAYLALDDFDQALISYEKALRRRPAPSLREKDSALNGISRMLTAKKASTQVIDTLIEKMQGK